MNRLDSQILLHTTGDGVMYDKNGNWLYEGALVVLL